MVHKKRRTESGGLPDLSKYKSYKALKRLAERHPKATGAERWAILERMRQVRFGYAPGSLRMDKIVFKQYNSLAEFREATEKAYAEEIRKYGPR